MSPLPATRGGICKGGDGFLFLHSGSFFGYAKVEDPPMNEVIDTLVLSLTSERYQKVVKIITLVFDRAPDGANFEIIAARIRALVAAGKLQAAGDLTRWTHSEIRRAG
jgi:hypothetical protein